MLSNIQKFKMSMENNTIYVGNLSERTTEKTLEKVFSQYGDVKNVRIISNKFAFIEFIRIDDAEMAVSKGNRERIDGKSVKVEF